MKLRSNVLNKESTHFSVGLNTFSIASNILLWAHLVGHLTWWALPITVFVALIGYGTEMQERKKSNTLSL
jgi:hypothetical protein